MVRLECGGGAEDAAGGEEAKMARIRVLGQSARRGNLPAS
jgi:hypothetical protein